MMSTWGLPSTVAYPSVTGSKISIEVDTFIWLCQCVLVWARQGRIITVESHVDEKRDSCRHQCVHDDEIDHFGNGPVRKKVYETRTYALVSIIAFFESTTLLSVSRRRHDSDKLVLKLI
jgi:hypothetical protein